MIPKGYHLGEFEELVLVSTATLVDDAYGVSIMNFIITETGRNVNISAVHEVLPAGELIERLKREYVEAKQRICSN